MNRLRLAIVGFGALGRACALGLLEAGDLELAGVVRHSGGALPAAWPNLRQGRTVMRFAEARSGAIGGRDA